MKALILNSGVGSRMGGLTADIPKCMISLKNNENILMRQLRLLKEIGIKNIVITTGYLNNQIEELCKQISGMNITCCYNEKYKNTNYIYSIYKAKDFLNDDIILLHGDLVFEPKVLQDILSQNNSCVTVTSTGEITKKDFKGVIQNDKILKIGINYFENSLALQPLYYLKENEWLVWLKKINEFCEKGITDCYAENALNEITDKIQLKAFDICDMLCQEIDTMEDLIQIRSKV